MNKFLTELSRRNVFRVAAAYVIVGWVVLQVVSVLMPALHLPGWMPSVAFTILLIGFPVAMLLTWGFEMTPQGVRKIEAVAGPSLPSSKMLDLGLLAIAGLLVAVTLLRPVGKLEEDKASGTSIGETAQSAEANLNAVAETPEASIAVLAFANMSGDPENEYFSDGISEEILNALAGIKSMRVAARTSAFSFKGKDIDIRVIGETLDVAHVLEGSVRRSGNSVRVTAQLNNAASGYHLWSKTYDRELTDIFAVQEEIALAITASLKIELNLEEKEAIARQGTDNIEAYSAYLKGRELRAATDFYVSLGAKAYFERAVELDPNYSDAWGALALGYAPATGYLSFPSFEAQLAEAFSTALRLNPDEPGGRAAKAFHTTVTTHDWARAGELYRRALETDHSGITTGLYILYYLYPLGKYSEAIELFRKTIRRDPLNHALRREFAINNSFEGLYNEFALEQLDLLTEAGETFAMIPCLKAVNLVLLDRRDEALENLEKAGPPKYPWDMFTCTQANYYLERIDRFNSLFAELKDRASNQIGYDLAVAFTYGMTGDFDSWFKTMNPLLGKGDFGPETARVTLHFFPDHISDPRYQKLLKAVRLDDASLAEMGMTWGEQGSGSE